MPRGREAVRPVSEFSYAAPSPFAAPQAVIAGIDVSGPDQQRHFSYSARSSGSTSFGNALAYRFRYVAPRR